MIAAISISHRRRAHDPAWIDAGLCVGTPTHVYTWHRETESFELAVGELVSAVLDKTCESTTLIVDRHVLDMFRDKRTWEINRVIDVWQSKTRKKVRLVTNSSELPWLFTMTADAAVMARKTQTGITIPFSLAEVNAPAMRTTGFPEELWVGVDGSVGDVRRRGKNMSANRAGVGVVCDGLVLGRGVDTPCVITAEALAVAWALEKVCPDDGQHVRIATDCEALVHKIQDRSKLRKKDPAVIHALPSMIRQFESEHSTAVDVQWVKGHNGDPLNEMAHYVANVARKGLVVQS